MRRSGGSARGSGRRVSGSTGLRPTAQRVTDAVFNSLAARVPGARVLDLFAGTGRLGMEALGRGAAEAVFVERDPRHAALIRNRLVTANLAGRGQVWRANTLAAIDALARDGETFDLIFLDPPYGRGLVAQTLARLAMGTVLHQDGLAVAEGHWRDDPGAIAGLVRIRVARYGETAVWFYSPPVKREDEA
jgi:16S rRNA (guanine966-N2)-methyltransferase